MVSNGRAACQTRSSVLGPQLSETKCEHSSNTSAEAETPRISRSWQGAATRTRLLPEGEPVVAGRDELRAKQRGALDDASSRSSSSSPACSRLFAMDTAHRVCPPAISSRSGLSNRLCARKQAAQKVLPPCRPQSAHVVGFSSTSRNSSRWRGVELDPEQAAVVARLQQPHRRDNSSPSRHCPARTPRRCSRARSSPLTPSRAMCSASFPAVNLAWFNALMYTASVGSPWPSGRTMPRSA